MLLKQTQYNRWANQTICDFILKAGDAVADAEQKASFTSARKTLLHVWDGQVIWLNRLNGMSLSSFPSKDFKGGLAEACDGSPPAILPAPHTALPFSWVMIAFTPGRAAAFE